MKKTVFLLLLVLSFNINIYSQVKISSRTNKSETLVTDYDSLQNFVGSYGRLYKGQTLIVYPKPDILQKYGYEGFVFDSKVSPFDSKNIYRKNKKEKIKGLSSPYQDLVGRSFFVKDVIDGERFLLLEDTESKELIFFKYDYKYSHKFPFIVQGYFEKVKKVNINKSFYARTRSLNDYSKDHRTTDVNGEVFDAEIGSIWTVKDLSLVPSSLDPVLEFKIEGMGKEITVLRIAPEAKDIMNRSHFGDKEVFDEVFKDYGEEVFFQVLRRAIKEGMNKYLVRLAIGSPNRIHTSEAGGTVSEQWVYDGRYLYFENGILKTIQTSY